MKKWIAAVLCALMVLGAAGCSASPKQAETQPNTEKQTEAPAQAPAAEGKAEAPASETAAETPAAEAKAETPAAGLPEEAQDGAAAEADAAKERIVGGAFRFTVPADWAEQDNGSYSAVGGSVIISFYAFPFTANGYSMPEGIKVNDDAFPEAFVKLMNANDRGSWRYELSEERSETTAGGLDNRFMVLNVKNPAGGSSSIIMSAYDWNDEQVFAIMFEYGVITVGYAESCWSTINSTLERIG